jgi:hypothetical protein
VGTNSLNFIWGVCIDKLMMGNKFFCVELQRTLRVTRARLQPPPGGLLLHVSASHLALVSFLTFITLLLELSCLISSFLINHAHS